MKLAQGFGTCSPADAIEVLAMDAEEETDVVPAQNRAEDGVEFVKVERVRHGENADDHGTHVA